MKIIQATTGALFLLGAQVALAAHPAPAPDSILRVVVTPGSAVHEETSFPSSSKKWELHYQFVVPPLPNTKTWDYKNQVFYLWGDVDFDVYGSKGTAPLSSYLYNQIVPQLMMGWSYAGNDENYNPSMVAYTSWVIEAQYFWADKNDKGYALAGKPVPVSPGDLVTTVIRYNPDDGSILARISTDSVESTLTIPKPFPNEKLFSSWKDFFTQAEAKTGGHTLGQAVINVEAHGVDAATMCSLLPFDIEKMSGPHFPKSGAEDKTRTEGTFTCSTPLAKLGF